MDDISIYQRDWFGEMLTDGAAFSEKHHFPYLEAVKVVPEGECLPINYMTCCKNLSETWFHCFINDAPQQRYWYNFGRYVPFFKKAKGVISSDFSVLRDMDKDAQERNVYRSRCMAYAIHKVNPNTIPTAPFGGEDTWNWCFESLPKQSTYAVTTNVGWNDSEACRLFIGGVDALVKQKEPYALVVCGHCPDWLLTKYPNVKIVVIPNFSQWRRLCRRCG